MNPFFHPGGHRGPPSVRESAYGFAAVVSVGAPGARGVSQAEGRGKAMMEPVGAASGPRMSGTLCGTGGRDFRYFATDIASSSVMWAKSVQGIGGISMRPSGRFPVRI